ncbi:MAG TPA: chemotaxis protein CheX [Caldithrix abyssi]|uniref:Chemotaxis protein CheX n=1 Tax=Caldithrix abyssi TaxID=187145 RepID=A0A7V1LK94_CALAY|nr:chemotaxis protein CheX [Caldithrix abyssi]
MSFNIDAVGEELTDAVTEAFENMAFAEVESCEDVETLPSGIDAYCVTVDTLNPFKSKVAIIIDREASEELVMDMYGGDIEDVNEEIMNDALAEIGNTVVGRFLSRVVDEGQEFSLGFPECELYDGARYNRQKNDHTRLYDLDLDDYHIYCILESRN